MITKDMIPKILFPLPINKVYGLGNKSVKKLNNIGIFNIEELYNLPLDMFHNYFGRFGIEIYERVRGIDNREVITCRERKSIGKERTLKKDTSNKEELKEYIKIFSREIEKGLRSKNLSGRTLTLKIKTVNFESHTKSKTLNNYINSKDEIYLEGYEILKELNLESDIRLIGLTLSSLKENTIKQLSFLE